LARRRELGIPILPGARFRSPGTTAQARSQARQHEHDHSLDRGEIPDIVSPTSGACSARHRPQGTQVPAARTRRRPTRRGSRDGASKTSPDGPHRPVGLRARRSAAMVDLCAPGCRSSSTTWTPQRWRTSPPVGDASPRTSGPHRGRHLVGVCVPRRATRPPCSGGRWPARPPGPRRWRSTARCCGR
jgi:hypothetical protein